MTPEELDAIEARIPYGYPPPWTVDPWHEDEEGQVLRGWIVNAADAVPGRYGTVLMAPDYGEQHALWAVSARQDIPNLIAALRKAQAERQAAYDALTDYGRGAVDITGKLDDGIDADRLLTSDYDDLADRVTELEAERDQLRQVLDAVAPIVLAHLQPTLQLIHLLAQPKHERTPDA